MAWEMRRGGSRYFTRSRRMGTRVVREYVGGGVAGETAEREDALRRELLAEKRAGAAAQRTVWDHLDHLAGDLCGSSQALVHILLEANGYHRHQRGQWRKRREKN